MKSKSNHLTRRKLLQQAAGAGIAGVLAPLAGTAGTAPAKNGLIARENEHPGTTDWQLTYVRSEPFRSKWLEGYCSQISVRAGETLGIFLNANVPTDVFIDFYRMGYYGGKGGRFMQRLGPVPVKPQPDPPVSEHRLRICHWARSTAFTVPENWVSGVYLGKLSCSAHRYESYLIFVLRDDRKADILFQTSDTTWQAYNKWPDEFSLYDSDAPKQPLSSRTKVSYDRPFGKYPQVVEQPLSQGSGEFLLWEYPLCYWLEKHGYDVTYWANTDTHADRSGLDRVSCFLSVGHDEYWTYDMFKHVKEAVDNGLSAAFLSGNALMWVIELESAIRVAPSSVDQASGLDATSGSRSATVPVPNGLPNRVMSRIGRFGGLRQDEKALGIMGPFKPHPWPNENTLIGARTVYPFNGSADWMVSRPDHWIFEHTGMKKGDRIPGLVGWEHHGDPADIPGLEVIAEGQTINAGGATSHYTATVYPGPKGNWVFNAATIYWSIGLANTPGFVAPHSHFGRPHGEDERVQQITANFLKKCGIVPHAVPIVSGSV